MADEPKPNQCSFEEPGFRYSSYDTPFWVRPNSEPGRWHLPGDGPTQYLSTTVEGAWAELIRAEGLRTQDEVDLVKMPMWVAELHVQRIADYRTFQLADDAGFRPKALIEDSYGRCQEEGARLREAGFQGVIAPSAALPGGRNLTLFGPRIASTWGVRPVLASSIPATQIAVGSPPEGIVGRVRHWGESHAEYRAFVSARRAEKRRMND